MDHALKQRIKKSVAIEDVPTLILLTHIYASVTVEQMIKVLKQYQNDRETSIAAMSTHPGGHHAAKGPAAAPWISGRNKIAMPPPPNPAFDYVRTAVSVAETLIKASKQYKQMKGCE